MKTIDYCLTVGTSAVAALVGSLFWREEMKAVSVATVFILNFAGFWMVDIVMKELAERAKKEGVDGGKN